MRNADHGRYHDDQQRIDHESGQGKRERWRSLPMAEKAGLCIAAVSLIGLPIAGGSLYFDFKGDRRDSLTTQPTSGAPTSGPTTSASTAPPSASASPAPTGAAPTTGPAPKRPKTPAPPVEEAEVTGPSVRIDAASAGSRKVDVNAEIRRPPEAGHVYWLILKVDQVSGTHAEFYPRQKLSASTGSTSFSLTIPPDADIGLPRSATVVEVPAEVSARFAAEHPDPDDPGADFLLEEPCCAITAEVKLPFREN